MTKDIMLAKLEAAKEFTSVVSIDVVMTLIRELDPEVVIQKEIGMTQELADQVFARIERCLDYQSDNLVDLDSAEFDLSYDNRIELTRVDVEVSSIMNHIDSCLQDFIIDEDEPEIFEIETFPDNDEEAEEVVDGEPEE